MDSLKGAAAVPAPSPSGEYWDFRWAELEEFCSRCRAYAVYRRSSAELLPGGYVSFTHTLRCRCGEYGWLHRETPDGRRL